MNLKERLESLSDNQVEIARVAGVSKQAVSNWIARNSISASAAKKLSRHYKVSLDWIMSDNSDKKERNSTIKIELEQIKRLIPSATPRSRAVLEEMQTMIDEGIEITEQEKTIIISVLDSVRKRT